MTAQIKGQVADALPDNWVDRYAPMWAHPYLRLSRADRPIGTWLLFIPCIWGVLLAALAGGDFRLWDLWIIAGCGLGAFLMRGAGCTWNDIKDREFDAQVERTKSRPLPSGQATVRQAVVWMVIQALLAFCILITYSTPTILVGIASLALVFIYPFAKRFTWFPQLFLGFAFNWGALLAWTAHSGSIGWPAVGAYIAGIFWTLFYDTIYGHQDTDDDVRIGVKSTSRFFAEATPTWLRRFMVATVVMLTVSAMSAAIAQGPLALVVAMLGPWVMGWHLLWQLRSFTPDDSPNLARIFRSNRDAGLIVALFFAIAVAL